MFYRGILKKKKPVAKVVVSCLYTESTAYHQKTPPIFVKLPIAIAYMSSTVHVAKTHFQMTCSIWGRAGNNACRRFGLTGGGQMFKFFLTLHPVSHFYGPVY